MQNVDNIIIIPSHDEDVDEFVFQGVAKLRSRSSLLFIVIHIHMHIIAVYTSGGCVHLYNGMLISPQIAPLYYCISTVLINSSVIIYIAVDSANL